MAKIGEEFVKDMIDRGRRELGGVMFQESTVAQPMYPLRGGYEPKKEIEVPTVEAREESVLDEHIKGGRDSPDYRDLDEPEHDRY